PPGTLRDAALDLFVEPPRLFPGARVAEEGVDVEEAEPRQHALVGDAPADLRAQICEHLELALVARREIHVPALGGHRVIALAVEENPGHAEARPGGDERAVAARLARALVERVELFG